MSFDVELSVESFDIVKSHSLRWYDIALCGTLKTFLQLGDVGELPLLVTASLRSTSEGTASYGLVHTLGFDMRQGCDPSNYMVSSRWMVLFPIHLFPGIS